MKSPQITQLLKQDFRVIRELLEWRTGNGTMVPIEEMEDSHIKNTIIMLNEKQKACDELDLGDYDYAGCAANDWIRVLRRELQFREKPVLESVSKITL